MEFPSPGPVEPTSPTAPVSTLIPPTPPNDRQGMDAQAFLLAEYRSLRAEISRRSLIQSLLLLLSLFVAGVAIGFSSNFPYCYFVEPIFVLLLATLWLQQQHTIRSITAYLRDNIEKRWSESGGGWECWAQRKRLLNSPANSRLEHEATLTARGVFMGTQALILVLLLFLMPLPTWPFQSVLMWCFGWWTVYRVWSLFDMDMRNAAND